MTTPTPRPILKTRAATSAAEQCFPSPATALPFKFPISPHVHFPPTPTLTDTQITHSPFVYDRAPIVVSPNICKLPERGGRNYSILTPPLTVQSEPAESKGDYFGFRSSSSSRWEHPHTASDEHDELPPPPALVHDSHSSASESEESDACLASPVHTICTNVDNNAPNGHMHDQDTTTTSTTTCACLLTPTMTCLEPSRALSFLPHPRDSSDTLEITQRPSRPPQRPKPKRKQTGPRVKPPALLNVRDGTFSTDIELSLDGCLGGF